MARSKAQKEADARYAKKISGKYERFVVNLLPDEYSHICGVITAAGMGKAEFLRWAVNELQNKAETQLPRCGQESIEREKNEG